MNFSSLRSAMTISSPCGSFSVITVGAPIMQTGAISASSAKPSTSTSLHLAVTADRLLRHQLADIGIAAAAGSENGAAGRDVVEIGDVDQADELQFRHGARASGLAEHEDCSGTNSMSG